MQKIKYARIDQFSKDSERKVEGKVEPYYMSTCSSGSLKVCSSKQRSYEHFCSKGVLKADEKERSNVHVHFPKCDLKKQTESSSESSSFEGNTMKLESSVHQVASDRSSKEKFIGETEFSHETKQVSKEHFGNRK